MKNKIYDILVVGTGLSSLMFIEGFLEKNKKIDVISFRKTKKNLSQIVNNHIFKILPPQMIGKEKQVKDYFSLNKILVNKNANFFGSLEFGGLSNYWGLQIDKNIKDDISHLKSSTQKKIIKNFIEIFKKQNLLGQYNKIVENLFMRNQYLDNKIIKQSKMLYPDEPILAFKKKNKNEAKVKLDKINEKKDKLNPQNFFKKNLNKKRIKIHNYYVEKIKKHKKGIILLCNDGKNQKTFITKKLILACGTLITTKLVMDYLKIKKEVKINHHPRLFSVYFSKKKWKNNMEFEPSHLHLKPKKNSSLFTADFRPGNKIIVDAIIKFKKILLPLKFMLNLLREHLIFSNIFLNPSFGNLYLKKRDNLFEIYSKKKNIDKVFKKISGMIFDFLNSTKKFLPLYYNYFPGFGADFHYFGTILMGKKGVLSVNDRCQLRKDKRIFIVDGSVINFRKNKYPLGLIMANSRRISKEI